MKLRDSERFAATHSAPIDADGNPTRHDPWHVLGPLEVLQWLSSDASSGLTHAEVQRRLSEFGRNELHERSRRSAGMIFLEQFRGALILLLFVAALVSLFVGEHVDALAILAIIGLNAGLGFFQDYRAERAIAALKKLAIPIVRVRREGHIRQVGAAELVPGDIILLETGNVVPADCRLLESVNLQIQEAALTGESAPVPKQATTLDEAELLLAERRNMTYLGTTVTSGRGEAIVTATGMQTELGRIADSLQGVVEGPTPLQRRLAELGRTLALVAIGIVALVFVAGLLGGESSRLMLLTALSLAVAIVPEGLPAVATVALALGARRMAKRQALIRKLPAVETLGSVTVICSDKTGTLTENQMSVMVLDVAGLRQSASGVRDPLNLASARPSASSAAPQSPADHSGLTLLLISATLCNDSTLESDGDDVCAVGDPTEAAIVVASARFGFPKPQLDAAFPRVAEIPFDSDRKCMTTVHAQLLSAAPDGPWRQSLLRVLPCEAGEFLVCTKGAIDAVLERSAYVWDDDTPVVLDDAWRRRITQAQDELASEGMRVLGVGFRLIDDLPGQPSGDLEQDLIFIGMLAMIDPPRPEASDAIRRCRDAGIRPVMITGDLAPTAASIARSLGLPVDGRIVTGRDVTDDRPGSLTDDVCVYARVSPHDKLQIVKSLQERGEIVAMTGDGVNDAPALKQADIGVAMGHIGTDVAKEAADMVLLDDNFATIVNAVEEGRVVFDNIRKFVKYTMTSNAGELFVMILGPLLGMPLPLLPLQILWINLVTDGLPGLALAVERAEPGTMSRPPCRPQEAIFNREMIVDILWIGLLMAGVSLSLGYIEWSRNPDATGYWRTAIFTVLTISQMGNALATRSFRTPLSQIGYFSNRPLVGAVLLTLTLQLAVIYTPLLQQVFHTVPLSLEDLGLCFALGTIVFFAVEFMKRLHWQHGAMPASS